MKIKLAEALLRRKELNNKVAILRELDIKKLFELRVQRKPVNQDAGIDEIVMQIPKVSTEQITRAHDWHARQLRLIDAAIQQANWNTELDVDQSTMSDYDDPFAGK